MCQTYDTTLLQLKMKTRPAIPAGRALLLSFQLVAVQRHTAEFRTDFQNKSSFIRIIYEHQFF